ALAQYARTTGQLLENGNLEIVGGALLNAATNIVARNGSTLRIDSDALVAADIDLGQLANGDFFTLWIDPAADFRGSLTNLNGVIDMRLKPYVDAVEMLRYEGEQSLFQYSDDGQGGSFFKLLGDAATRADFSVRSYADLNTMMDWITGETNHDLDYRLTFNV